MRISQQSDFCPEIKAYFNEISNFENLEREQELELGRRINRGDRKAIDELVKANLKFVIYVANGYKNYGVPFADLIAEGNIGLLKAAEKFDYRKKLKFNSYAVWWIKAYIQDFIKKQLSRNDFSENDIKVKFKFNENEEYDNILDLGRYNVSTAFDDEHNEIEEYKNAKIDELLSTLNEREKEIIISYFGLNDGDEQTLDEIGCKHSLTKERVRQIKEKALKKLRVQMMVDDDFHKLKNML